MKLLALVVLLASLVCGPARAQDWPTQTTRMIVPFAPGSTPDILARLVSDKLAKNLGQAFVVENKPGAGGVIGTNAIARAAPDGTTLGVSIGGPLVNNTVLSKSLPYDPFVDLAPVTLAVNQPCLLVATDAGASALKATRVADLMTELARDPDRYNYASLGNGTISHLVMVLLSNKARARLVQVPYPGSSQAVAALIAGEASLACLPPSNVLPQVGAGRLRVLGIAAKARSPLFPDIPTLSEQDLGGIEANAWIGVVAPAKTSPAIVARMQREIAKALADPDVARALKTALMEPVGSSPEAFAAYLKEELARWGPIIRDNHITLD